ncbi:hypothetical protein hairong_119 [Pseudomonas phage hairong]|nr:hypothetical protein hairong_119 [Pseudomonas phage hairong]
MSKALTKHQLEAGQFYLMVSHSDKTAETILIDKKCPTVYYRNGIAQDYDLENVTTEVFYKVPTPEGYTAS